jgi:transposase
MNASRWQGERIYLYRHRVDMRKGARGLSALVELELDRHPTDRCLYVFCNRGRDKIRLLIWDRNGYWLLAKNLIKQRFSWPDWFRGDSLVLSDEHLDLLLDGFNLNAMRPHQQLIFAHAF